MDVAEIKGVQDVKLPTDIPEPKRGGTYLFCPHVTAETIKKPRKKAVVVTTPCKFKTLNYKKFLRHWLNRHAERPAAVPAPAPVLPVEAEPVPKYPAGDDRNRKDRGSFKRG
jgi:hypothetical protein